MFLLYRVLFCNFANSSQFCKTFLGLISCKCCNIVFFLSLLYVVFIFPPCKCKYCHKKCCNQINVIKKKKKVRFFALMNVSSRCGSPFHANEQQKVQYAGITDVRFV